MVGSGCGVGAREAVTVIGGLVGGLVGFGRFVAVVRARVVVAGSVTVEVDVVVVVRVVVVFVVVVRVVVAFLVAFTVGTATFTVVGVSGGGVNEVTAVVVAAADAVEGSSDAVGVGIVVVPLLDARIVVTAPLPLLSLPSFGVVTAAAAAAAVVCGCAVGGCTAAVVVGGAFMSPSLPSSSLLLPLSDPLPSSQPPSLAISSPLPSSSSSVVAEGAVLTAAVAVVKYDCAVLAVVTILLVTAVEGGICSVLLLSVR